MKSSVSETGRHRRRRAGKRASRRAAHVGPRNSASAPTPTANASAPAPHNGASRPPGPASGAATAPASTAASARKSNRMLIASDDAQSALFTPSPRFNSAQYANSPARAGSMSTNMLRASVTPNIRPRPGSGAAPAPASSSR